MTTQNPNVDPLNSANPTAENKTLANQTSPPEVKPPADSEKSDSGEGADAANADPATEGGKGAGKPKRAYTPRKKRGDAVGQGPTTVTTSTAAKDATDPIEVGVTREWSQILKKAQDKIQEETDVEMPYSKLNEWACSEIQLDKKVATYCRVIRDADL